MNERTEDGVEIVPASSVQGIAKEAGLDDAQAVELESVYIESQLSSLRTAFFGLILLALLSLLVSRGIPNEVPSRRPATSSRPADATG